MDSGCPCRKAKVDGVMDWELVEIFSAMPLDERLQQIKIVRAAFMQAQFFCDVDASGNQLEFPFVDADRWSRN